MRVVEPMHSADCPTTPGSDEDGHGCILSAGSWCEPFEASIRPWLTKCAALEDNDMPFMVTDVEFQDQDQDQNQDQYQH